MEDINKNQLEQLRNTLQKAQRNTLIMSENITAFETRLVNLDQNLRPVYDDTILLSRARKNIMRTLLVLDKMTEYFKVADEVDKLVAKGLSEEANLPDFCEGIERLVVARAFFTDHNDVKASDKALATVTSSLERALALSEKEMKKLLTIHGCLIEPSSGLFKVQVSKLSLFNSVKLIALGQCIGNGTENYHYHVYSNCRTQHIQKDIKKLFETASEAQGVQGVDRNATGPSHLVPWKDLFLTLPYNTGCHPFKLYYSIITATIKGEYELWKSTINVCRNKEIDAWWRDAGKLQRTTEAKRSEALEREFEQIDRSHEAFCKLCEVLFDDIEKKLTPLLVNNSNSTENSTSIFKRLGRLGRMKQSSAGPSSSGGTLRQSNILFIRLDILSIFLTSYADLREVCIQEEDESDAAENLTNIRDTLVAASIESITTFLAAVSKDSKDSLPVSIDVNDVTDDSATDDFNSCDMSATTGHIISFLREIMKYQHVYGDLIDCASSIGGSSMEYLIPQNVAEFISATQDALMLSLEARYNRFTTDTKKRSTQFHHDHALHSAGLPEADGRLRLGCKHLYMANNVCHLYLFLKEGSVVSAPGVGSLSDEYLLTRQKFISTLETRLLFESGRFVDTIVKSSGLMDVLDDLEAAGGPGVLAVQDKEKLLKQKFSVFNATIEAWTSHQGEWRISTDFLRDAVKKDLTRKIMPIYTEFYETYSVIKFSKKNQDKYLKFPPEDVNRIIQGFFR